MNRTVKLLIALVGGSVLLCVGTVAVMAVGGFCPPAGPWPMPPWCDASQAARLPALDLNDLATQAQQLDREDLSNVPIPVINPYSEGMMLGYVEPTPTAPAGEPVEVVFEAALPRSSEAVTLQVNGRALPLESHEGYWFTSAPLSAAAGEELVYGYSAGELHTPEQRVTVWSDLTVRDGLRWMGEQASARPGFVKGVVAMDAGGNNIIDLRSGHIDETLAAVQHDGGEWFFYDYYWSYQDYIIPTLVDESTFPELLYPSRQDLTDMAAHVHERGMHFGLITSVEWNILPGHACFRLEPLDAYMDCMNAYWLEGKAHESQMLERLKSGDPEAAAYGERWFEAYRQYMLYAAEVAEAEGIDMLVIGKLLVFANDPMHEAAWEALIGDIRAVYSGRLALIIEAYNDEDPFNRPWADQVDLLVYYLWNRISEEPQPSMDTLAAEFDRLNRVVFRPLYETYGTPIVLLTPFQSRDHAAAQDWVEPLSSAPGVERDWLAQADLYQSFWEAVIDEPWFQGLSPYGYWFFDSFHPELALDRSYNVRNKPGGMVVRSWFAGIEAAGGP